MKVGDIVYLKNVGYPYDRTLKLFGVTKKTPIA